MNNLDELPSSSSHENAGYGSIEGEQYFLPLAGGQGYGKDKEVAFCEYALSLSASNSTVSSYESDVLLERHDHVGSVPSEVAEPAEYSCADRIFRGLGFRQNPFRDGVQRKGKNSTSRNTSSADLRLSMLSNFSTSYNILSISLSLKIMDQLYQTTHTEQDQSSCSSALIAGMIVGQLAGGALGDMLGRHRAMTVVMFLQVTAALCSAMSFGFTLNMFGAGSSWTFSIYQVLAAWRFVLGLGAGGVYPLAATLTAESSQSKRDRAKSVALIFSFQGIGYLAVPVATWIVVSIFGQSSDFSWRVVLGLGAVPGIILTARRLESIQHHSNHHKRVLSGDVPSLEAAAPAIETPLKEDVDRGSLSSVYSGPVRRLIPVSVFEAIQSEKDLVRKLIGTGGCWLMFDVLFYGNTLFQPVVLAAAFGSAETVAKSAQDTALLALLALPGYYVSVFAVGRQSPWFIQIQGFFIMGLLYLVIGISFDVLAGEKAVLLLTYGSTFFFSNYGPNATTFMLPSMTFSKHCRSTLNGICAAMGKIGAFLGTVVFVAATDRFGQRVVFTACAVLSFVGCIVTLICISPKTGVVNSEHDDRDDCCDGNDDDDENSMAPMRSQNLSEDALREILVTSKIPMKVVVSQPSLMDYYSRP